MDSIIKVEEEIIIEIKPEIILPNINTTVENVMGNYEIVEEVKQEVEEEMLIEIKPEIILPNINKPVDTVLGNYEFVEIVEEVKQEEDVNIENEKYMEDVTKVKYEFVGEIKPEENVNIEYLEEVEQEVDVEEVDVEVVEDMEEDYVTVVQDVEVEYEYNETYDDPADESYEENEDHDDTYSEESDNPDSDNFSMEEKNISKKPKPLYYECKKCFEKFPNLDSLKKHQQEMEHPPNPSSVCPVCKRIIGYRSIKQHMMRHTGIKPYGCEICGAKYNVVSSLTRHKRAQHSEPNARKYSCQYCEKIFEKLDLLKVHQKFHWGNQKEIFSREFQCGECCRAFKTNALLEQHSTIIHRKKSQPKVQTDVQSQDNKQGVCSICSKVFNHPNNLKRHMSLHTGEKHYACEVCNKSFKRADHRKIHMRTHTGEKSYTCEICKKSFNRHENLKCHMSIHTGEKRYTCQVCNRAFNRFFNLQCHMSSHTGDKPYLCDVCGKGFYTNSSLIQHKLIHPNKNERRMANTI